MPKPTKNTYKIANKLMANPSGKINLQSKYDLICHTGKVKAVTVVHSMADAITFQNVCFIPTHQWNQKKIHFIRDKENINIFRRLILQQAFGLLAEHLTLHDVLIVL